MRTLYSTIKNDGDYVRVTIDTDGERKSYTVSLVDYIDSLSTSSVQRYYPTETVIPTNIVQFRYMRNMVRFSCQAVIRIPAQKHLINYCSEDFYVPLPDLVFKLTVVNGKLEGDTNSKAFAAIGDKLYHFPLSNVYADGNMCWGSIRIPTVSSLLEIQNIAWMFISAPGNSDLGLSSGLYETLNVASMGELLKFLETQDVFPIHALTPFSGTTVHELLN